MQTCKHKHYNNKAILWITAVRQDRAPGGRHRHASLQDHKQKKPRLSNKPCKSASVDEPTNIQSDDQFIEESETASDYLEIVDQISQYVSNIPGDPQPDAQPDGAMVTDGNEDEAKGLDVGHLMQSAYRELYDVILWGKSVPGFKELSLGDQITLLKTSFMDLNVFRLAYRSIPCDPQSLRFSSNVICDAQACMEMGWSKDLTETTLEFCGKLRNLNIDVNEFACLSALVLLSPGKNFHVLFTLSIWIV